MTLSDQISDPISFRYSQILIRGVVRISLELEEMYQKTKQDLGDSTHYLIRMSWFPTEYRSLCCVLYSLSVCVSWLSRMDYGSSISAHLGNLHLQNHEVHRINRVLCLQLCNPLMHARAFPFIFEL